MTRTEIIGWHNLWLFLLAWHAGLFAFAAVISATKLERIADALESHPCTDTDEP